MEIYDPDRQQKWEAIIAGLRTLMALSALALLIALGVPVLAGQLPPVILLLAAWSVIGWLVVALFRSPPNGWRPPADFERVERNLARIKKVSWVHLAIFGGVDAVLLILILARVVRPH